MRPKHRCVNSCEKDDKAALASRLFLLSQMTWAEIGRSPRHGLGHETISRDALNAPIPQGISEDVTFLAFRFSGKKAMVGYKDARVFHIIWLDRDFKLYAHG